MLKKMPEEKYAIYKEETTPVTTKVWMSAKELAATLDVSLSKAYKLIAILNQELADQGFLTIPGKIPVTYMRERFYLK